MWRGNFCENVRCNECCIFENGLGNKKVRYSNLTDLKVILCFGNKR
jgi:hypothetical protein